MALRSSNSIYNDPPPPPALHSYTWRGEGITLKNLVAAVEASLEAHPEVSDPEAVACFVDVFVCAQHRGTRPGSSTCANANDVGKFEEVVDATERLVLYATPLTQPKALSRVWCLFELMSAMKRDRAVIIALSGEDRIVFDGDSDGEDVADTPSPQRARGADASAGGGAR